jgi:hypothetical protein
MKAVSDKILISLDDARARQRDYSIHFSHFEPRKPLSSGEEKQMCHFSLEKIRIRLLFLVADCRAEDELGKNQMFLRNKTHYSRRNSE